MVAGLPARASNIPLKSLRCSGSRADNAAYPGVQGRGKPNADALSDDAGQSPDGAGNEAVGAGNAGGDGAVVGLLVQMQQPQEELKPLLKQVQ